MKNTRFEKIITETKIWAILAWTIPFSLLSLLFFINLFGSYTIYNKILTIIGVGFVTVSVIWWWWAVKKIVQFAKTLAKTDETLLYIKKEISTVKEEL